MNKKGKQYAGLLFLFILVFTTGWTGFTQQLLVRCNGYDIKTGGQFGFDSIDPSVRGGDVVFTITNMSDTAITLTGNPRIWLANTTDFMLVQDIQAFTLSKGQSYAFTLKFISQATDGKSKTSAVTINNNSVQGNFSFKVSCLAKVSGVIEFKEPGTYYWKAPYACSATVIIVGGGGGGGNAGCVPRFGEGYGAGGGGAGEILFIQNQRLNSIFYNITIGSGGINGRNGNSSQFYGSSINLVGQAGRNPNGGAGYPSGKNGKYGTDQVANGGDGGDNGNGFGKGGLSGGDSKNGQPGYNAPANSGGGGLARCDVGPGGTGGTGGSGYVKIEWTGWLR